MESVYCVNCGSAGGSMLLEDEQIRHCVQQWTAPLLVITFLLSLHIPGPVVYIILVCVLSDFY